MDSAAEGADALEVAFKIGPSTLAGRTLALRIIFCRNFRKLLLILRSAVAARISVARKWSLCIARGLRRWMDPSTPHFVLASVLLVGILLRRQRLRSVKEVAALQCQFWRNLMRTALTYEEWAYAAGMVEKHQIGNRRKDDELYDEDLVRAKLGDLRKRRLQGDVNDIVFALRTDLLRNLGNMCNPELHRDRLQTPELIQDYIAEVRCHLREVCDADSAEMPLEEKLAFMHETRHAFGRTALMLSGGAALGAFHLGVVRTLIEHRLLPRVLSGASVGSIICSFVATRTWTELQQFFDDPMPPIQFFESMGSLFATAHRLLTRGALQEIGMLQRKMRLFIGDLTFQEAYDLSGRVLGIPVTSSRANEPHRLLNYLTAPHVVIWSAVTASCAFPGLFEAQELMAKDRQGRIVPYHMPTEGSSEAEASAQLRRWKDGSLESDLPMRELKELFNVNHFVVAQANPHIAPLLRIKEACRTYGGTWGGKLAQLVEMETKHRCHQALALGWRLGGLAKLFGQEWEGDVTIVMPATLAQFAKLIQNPTPSEVRKAVIQGRRCTWEKLSAIQANCGIEIMLDECVSTLKQRRKNHHLLLLQQQQQQQHQALPSKTASGRVLFGPHPHPHFSCQPGRGGAVPSGVTLDSAPCRDPQCPQRFSGTAIGMQSNAPHVPPSAGSSSFWRRIPSWNRFSRERSWGSLEEDNNSLGLVVQGIAAAPGGGLAAPAPAPVPGSLLDGVPAADSSNPQWLQGAGIQGTYLQHVVGHGHASGDSDSDNEGAYYLQQRLEEGSGRSSLLRSWTRAGGPLMASPSCSCMLQLHEAAMSAASAPNLGVNGGGTSPGTKGITPSRSFKGIEQVYQGCSQGQELERIKGMEPQSSEEEGHGRGREQAEEGSGASDVLKNSRSGSLEQTQGVFELPGGGRHKANQSRGRGSREAGQVVVPLSWDASVHGHHGSLGGSTFGARGAASRAVDPFAASTSSSSSSSSSSCAPLSPQTQGRRVPHPTSAASALLHGGVNPADHRDGARNPCPSDPQNLRDHHPHLSQSPSFSLWSAAPKDLLRPLLGPFWSSPVAPAPSVASAEHGTGSGARSVHQQRRFLEALGAAEDPSWRAGRKLESTSSLGREGMEEKGTEAAAGGAVEEEEEQGMLFGLAMESSMHGHRSASLSLPQGHHPGVLGPNVTLPHPAAPGLALPQYKPGATLPLQAQLRRTHFPPLLGDVYGSGDGHNHHPLAKAREAAWGLPALSPGLATSMSDGAFNLQPAGRPQHVDGCEGKGGVRQGWSTAEAGAGAGGGRYGGGECAEALEGAGVGAVSGRRDSGADNRRAHSEAQALGVTLSRHGGAGTGLESGGGTVADEKGEVGGQAEAGGVGQGEAAAEPLSQCAVTVVGSSEQDYGVQNRNQNMH